jgi:5-formyltetrahydrofolate cyclo-ligase
MDKKAVRDRIMAARNAEPGKNAKSRAICERVLSLPEFERARVVQFYIDVRSEARTRSFIPRVMELGKKVVVPYCVEDHLELFPLDAPDELEVGAFKILEPRRELRGLANKRFSVSDVDLILVPGVVFDRRGGRMGHGWGFYDRLLERAGPATRLIALAFECQLIDQVPMEPHDIYVDKVVTEKTVYEGLGRSGAAGAASAGA